MKKETIISELKRVVNGSNGRFTKGELTLSIRNGLLCITMLMLGSVYMTHNENELNLAELMKVFKYVTMN